MASPMTKTSAILSASVGFALCSASPTVLAANAAFQDFLFQACTTAGGSLANRCNESNGGDVSGDSESSLNPSQLLAQNANALQEAKANVRAIRDKESGQFTESDQAVSHTQFEQWGVLLMMDRSSLERDASELERGYDVDMSSLKLALDYRYSDRSIVGVILGLGETETTLDKYTPSGDFPDYNPAQSGVNDSDSTTFSLFFTHHFDDQWYMDILGNYARIDYTFERNAIFQVSTRDFELAVNTLAETEGEQLAFSIGAGYTQAVENWNYGFYGRFDYQDSTIDGYQEAGGNGLALAVGKLSSDQSIATLGARVSSAISTEHGVLVPQAYIELEQKFGDGEQTASVSLVDGQPDARLALRGDDPDSSGFRWGISLTGIMPGGIHGYLAYSQDVAVDDIDRFQVNGGVRLEF